MFGYDWPRLHAALNDLPAALLLMAALFELLRRRLKLRVGVQVELRLVERIHR